MVQRRVGELEGCRISAASSKEENNISFLRPTLSRLLRFHWAEVVAMMNACLFKTKLADDAVKWPAGGHVVPAREPHRHGSQCFSTLVLIAEDCVEAVPAQNLWTW